MKRETNFPIHNTFGIPSRARVYIEYESEQELESLIPQLAGQSFLHVGGGSNLLLTGDFDGVVLHCGIRSIDVLLETDDDVIVRVGGGVVWDSLVETAISRGWYGAENLSLVPGEVGASAVQNIGAYGVEAKDLIWRVEGYNLSADNRFVLWGNECDYGYRQSIFKHQLRGQCAITYVCYKFSKHFTPKLDYGNLRSHIAGEPTAQSVRQAVVSIRRSKLPDPEELGNAGSFFMNPVVTRDVFERLQAKYPQMPYYEAGNGVKIPAGWLIEQCGWKGRSLGPAGVHDRQALVLVNRGGATGADILALRDAICKDVLATFGIEIQSEVQTV